MSGADRVPLSHALALSEAETGVWTGEVAAGYDVFGNPHGGYLAALGAKALLLGSGQPDLFTVTTHFLRKPSVGPIRFEVEPMGGSRRLTQVRATARQGDRLVCSQVALVGVRAGFSGPSWAAAPAWTPEPAHMLDASTSSGFPTVADAMRMQIDRRTAGFGQGEPSGEAEIRLTCAPEPLDVFTAIIASDLNPPAIWEIMGMKGWVPTIELTTHVRNTPESGPFRVRATSCHLEGGFLEEDATVYDGTGRLIVQSRQLACYTSGS